MTITWPGWPMAILPGAKFAGMKIVLDCANGAASNLAPRLFRSLGAEVVAINSTPDGKNINAHCGSLYPEGMQQRVVKSGAALGVAFDGDADRAIFSSATGKLVDGDGVLLVVARYLKSAGKLKGDVVVGTTMANLGLERALESSGLKLARTAVGDRYVLEEMQRIGANFGGEQSGHILFLDDATTGDGMLTALKIASIISIAGPLDSLLTDLKIFPAENFERARALEAAARHLAGSFEHTSRSGKGSWQFRARGVALFRDRAARARDGGSRTRRGCASLVRFPGFGLALSHRHVSPALLHRYLPPKRNLQLRELFAFLRHYRYRSS